MNSKRLLRLADHLEGLPAKNFNLGTWAHHDDSGEWEDFAELDDHGRILGWKQATCGYSACAIGHSASVREFRNVGFGMVIDPGHNTAIPKFGSLRGWSAVREFFNLDQYEANNLFSCIAYREPVTPGDVAARIREVVARGAAGHIVLR